MARPAGGECSGPLRATKRRRSPLGPSGLRPCSCLASPPPGLPSLDDGKRRELRALVQSDPDRTGAYEGRRNQAALALPCRIDQYTRSHFIAQTRFSWNILRTPMNRIPRHACHAQFTLIRGSTMQFVPNSWHPFPRQTPSSGTVYCNFLSVVDFLMRLPWDQVTLVGVGDQPMAVQRAISTRGGGL